MRKDLSEDGLRARVHLFQDIEDIPVEPFNRKSEPLGHVFVTVLVQE